MEFVFSKSVSMAAKICLPGYFLLPHTTVLLGYVISSLNTEARAGAVTAVGEGTFRIIMATVV